MIAAGQMLSSDFTRLLSHRVGYRPQVTFSEVGTSRFLVQRLPRAPTHLPPARFISCSSTDATSCPPARCCFSSRRWRAEWTAQKRRTPWRKRKDAFRACASNPEFALERALDALAYSEDESGFSADLNEDEQPLFESFQSTAPSKRHKKTPADFSARGFPGHRLSQTSATNTSAMRILNAAPVSVGFTHEDDGMTLVPAINRFE